MPNSISFPISWNYLHNLLSRMQPARATIAADIFMTTNARAAASEQRRRQRPRVIRSAHKHGAGWTFSRCSAAPRGWRREATRARSPQAGSRAHASAEAASGATCERPGTRICRVLWAQPATTSAPRPCARASARPTPTPAARASWAWASGPPRYPRCCPPEAGPLRPQHPWPRRPRSRATRRAPGSRRSTGRPSSSTRTRTRARSGRRRARCCSGSSAPCSE